MKQLLYLLPALILLSSCDKDEPTSVAPNLTNVSVFRSSGLDVGWDQSGSNRIAYSMKESDTYYDIHFAQTDGSNDICLTCNSSLLPNKHIACPYWHPGGKWLLMVVEDSTHPGSSTDALPGFGAYSDVWVMNTEGTKAYKIIDLPNDADHGVIAPRFSHDGKHIVWTDRKLQPSLTNPLQQMGYWTIKMADFKFNPSDSVPVVSNIRTFEPGGDAFYESYGFSPDDSKIIFCSSINQTSVWNQMIYTIDTLGGSLTKLTESDYNEHAFYKPDGSKIVWMTNTQATAGGTDWWMMNPDGSNKKRLTYFNENNNTQWAGHAVWAGLGSFSPDGTHFVGGRQVSLITQEGEIMMVHILQ